MVDTTEGAASDNDGGPDGFLSIGGDKEVGTREGSVGAVDGFEVHVIALGELRKYPSDPINTI